jgi:type VI secretion system protein ImpF
MARNIAESSATVSVLDRLIDSEPTNPYEAPLTRAESVRAVKADVRRHLEWLLNTRRVAVEPSEALKELNRSLYMFGLPDLIGFAMASQKDRARLLRTLQNAVRLFEPRLASVRIVPLDEASPSRQMLAFRIEGLLIMDPAPEHVSFDTVLELTRGEYNVKGDADAR